MLFKKKTTEQLIDDKLKAEAQLAKAKTKRVSQESTRQFLSNLRNTVLGLGLLTIGVNCFIHKENIVEHFDKVYKNYQSDQPCYGNCFYSYNNVMTNKGFQQIGKSEKSFDIKTLQNLETKFKMPRIFVIEYKGGFSTEMSEQFRDELEMIFAATDRRGDQVVIKIDSFGGEASACANDYEMVKEGQEMLNLKFIAIVDNHALSCGYFLAASADKIIVNPGADIGNIGSAFIKRSNPADVMIKRAGGNVEYYATTPTKRLLVGDDAKNQSERDILQAYVDKGGKRFFDKVIEGRKGKLDSKDHALAFSGIPFSGDEAVKLGLADETGNFRLYVRGPHIMGLEIYGIDNFKKDPFLKRLIAPSMEYLESTFIGEALKAYTANNGVVNKEETGLKY